MHGDFLRRHFSRRDSFERMKINNPFRDKSLDQIDQESAAFAKLVDQGHGDSVRLKQIFHIAGRISYNPPDWNEGIGADLSKYEKNVLHHEWQRGLFYQPKTLIHSVVVLWLSASIQGWIQSTLNGANLTWYRQIGVPGSNPTLQTGALWIAAGTNASVFLVAAGACFLSDPLQSRFLGRRGIIFVAAVLCFAASIGAACVDRWYQLLGCRIVLGAAMGLKASVTPIFAAEVSPRHLRGAIVMGWQAGDALGIFLGFTANLIVSYTTHWQDSWRWQTASIAIPAFGQMLLVWTIPDSPRLHLKRGQYAQAFAAMCHFRETPVQAARDLFYANAQLQLESDMLLKNVSITKDEKTQNEGVTRYQARVRKLWWWNRVMALRTNKRTRRALQASLIVMIAQQLCGFNVLAFYSNNVFNFNAATTQAAEAVHAAVSSTTQSAPPNRAATWLSWGIGLCNFVCTLPAFLLIDRWGRVSLLLVTYPFMIIFMLSICVTFGNAGDTIPKQAVEALAFFFTAAYSLGQGPVAFTYAAEVFPLVYRESGMGVAVAANFFGAGLLTLLVPQAQFSGPSSWAGNSCADSDSKDCRRFNISQAWMLGTFVFLELLAFVLIFLFVPETGHALPAGKGDLNHMSLEELNSIFEQATLHHTSYRLREALPHTLKTLGHKMVLREFDQPKKPMYRWDAKDNDNESQTLSARESSFPTKQTLPTSTSTGGIDNDPAQQPSVDHLRDGATMPQRPTAKPTRRTEDNPTQSSSGGHLHDGATMPQRPSIERDRASNIRRKPVAPSHAPDQAVELGQQPPLPFLESDTGSWFPHEASS